MPCSIPPPEAQFLEGGENLTKFRNARLAALVILSTLTASFPAHADTAGRPDDPAPDEIYYGVSGPEYAEDKGGGAAPQVAPSAPPAGPLGSPLTPVSFPYTKSNWTILSWYSTGDGLRFYGVYYKNEQILFDYRVPWVGVNNIKHGLSTQQLVSGPDLWVYNADYFLVWAKYNLGNPNIDVYVITRFYGDGTIEPWVLLNAGPLHYDLYVPQRFDFDLGGSDDDNQQYYNGSAWKAPTTETSTLDSWYGENASGYQWRNFDTDQSGNGNFIDQEIDVKPYAPDASRWYSLVYNNGEINGDPVGYLNFQTINTYAAGQPDPWIGYDGVNWYVSSYTQVALAYPGPWVKVFV
jgi:hypothetical protein